MGYVEIFGVKFNKDEVKQLDGKPAYQVEMVVENGKVRKEALVTMTDGTVLRYPQQQTFDNGLVPTVMKHKGTNTTCFNNIKGLTVWDTKNDDNYSFSNCQDGVVNAKRESQYTFGHVMGGGISYRESTFTRSTDKDKITLNGSCQNMQVNYTKGYDVLRVF